MEELTFKEIIENLDREYTRDQVRNAYAKCVLTMKDHRNADKHEYPIRDINEIISDRPHLYLEDCFDKMKDGLCGLTYFEIEVDKNKETNELQGINFKLQFKKIKIID